MSWRRAENLSDYIKRKYESKAAFAKSIGVNRQQVNTWNNGGFVVIRDTLYSQRRDIKPKRIDTTDIESELTRVER